MNGVAKVARRRIAELRRSTVGKFSERDKFRASISLRLGIPRGALAHRD
jgi:hypothetical protein